MLTFLADRPRLRLTLVAAAAVGFTALLVLVLFPGTKAPGRGTPMALVFTGAVYGLVGGLFATGLILIYRTMRFINFMQGIIGTLGVTLVSYILVFTPVPFAIALPLGFLVSVTMGVLVGVVLLRFFRSSRLFITVATIVAVPVVLGGIGLVQRMPFWPSVGELTTAQAQDLQSLSDDLPFQGLDFHIGKLDLPFGFEHIFAIEIAVIALLLVGAFLRFTRAGSAVRAMAENPERASLLGIGVGGLSVLVWAIAAGLDFVASISAFAAAPEFTVSGGDPQAAFEVLMIPFAAAVLARFRSIPQAVGIAVLLGILRLAWDNSFPHDAFLFYVVIFGLISGGLLLQRKSIGRSEAGAAVSWSATEEPRAVPEELRNISTVRIARWMVISLGVLFVVIYPWTVSEGRAFDGSRVIVRTIAVLSLVVLTGWAGQVSLGQWAMVAVGSVVGGSLTANVGLSFWLAVPATVAIVAVVAVIVGLPALRIRGLFLLVSTLAFAVVVGRVLFDEKYFGWLLPGDAVERPSLLFVDFESQRAFYYLSVVFLVLAVVVLFNLRRSRFGRVLIALRENEANVQSFGISPVRAKLISFAVAGALAGFAGILNAHLNLGASADDFKIDDNVTIFVAAVVGGVSSAGGALLGSIYFEVVTRITATNQIAAFIFANGGPILLLFAAPRGLISLVYQARDSALRVIAQRRRIVVPSLFADYDPDVLERQLIPLGEPDLSSGLAVISADERFALASELYKGRGERIIDKLGPPREARDAAAFRAAATAAIEAETERALEAENETAEVAT